MPGFDGTGPGGMGPMKGGGRGLCNSYRSAYGMTPYYGFGRGIGRGMIRGMRRGMGFGMGRGLGRGMYYDSRWNYPRSGYGYHAPIPTYNPYANPYSPYPYGW